MIKGLIERLRNKVSSIEEEKKKKDDRCTRIAKRKYDAWPSAYASGALVKCRKVGAANWGNKSKKEGMEQDPLRDMIREAIAELAEKKTNKRIPRKK